MATTSQPTGKPTHSPLSACVRHAMLQKRKTQNKLQGANFCVVRTYVHVFVLLPQYRSQAQGRKLNSKKTPQKTAAVSRVSFFLRLLRARQPFCEASLAATFGGSLSAPNLLVSPRVDGGVGDTTVRGRETRGGGCLGNAGRL